MGRPNWQDISFIKSLLQRIKKKCLVVIFISPKSYKKPNNVQKLDYFLGKREKLYFPHASASGSFFYHQGQNSCNLSILYLHIRQPVAITYLSKQLRN